MSLIKSGIVILALFASLTAKAERESGGRFASTLAVLLTFDGETAITTDVSDVLRTSADAVSRGEVARFYNHVDTERTVCVEFFDTVTMQKFGRILPTASTGITVTATENCK